MHFILAFEKKSSIFAPPKTIWCDEFVAQQVEHNTFNVGVLGSSPSEFTRRQFSDCRLFFVCSATALSKERGVRVNMQAYTRHSFLLICKAYPPQNKNGKLADNVWVADTAHRRVVCSISDDASRHSSPSEFTRRQFSDCRLFFVCSATAVVIYSALNVKKVGK